MSLKKQIMPVYKTKGQAEHVGKDAVFHKIKIDLKSPSKSIKVKWKSPFSFL